MTEPAAGMDQPDRLAAGPAHQPGPPADFAAAYGFRFDGFQVEAVTALAEGRSVLVAAPTGAGKTVVGEFAVWDALARGGKCFYTTPIKALSNQKYLDLVDRHGSDAVGLLTGDRSVNGDAPVVVMTTEVLRNMLYEASPTLAGLHAVVLDEVHYLADPERGAVWEEVIVQLPPRVQLACLSATVSNAEEFGAWLRGVRETCDVVITEARPVPLEHSYYVNDRLYPVFRAGGKKSGSTPKHQQVQAAREGRGGVPNPEVVMLERRQRPSGRPSSKGRRQPAGPRLRMPRRSEVTLELARRQWLPAIYFVFSRSGCDQAVDQLTRDGVGLTTDAEADEIREVVERRTADLDDGDLEVLGYPEWLAALERGLAAHHAGMVPVFKETVEELFVRGLVKVCFATETLALGINMPARTVVIERLEKWTGERHALLSPGQFTQLTGRAGRRGLDRVGHAVVLYQRDVDFETVASLVGRRVEPLTSSFAPSYNMAVNLLRRRDRADAEALLARSFAQFQADRTVGGEEERIARNREALDGYAANLTSDHGDFAEYWELRRELSRLEKEDARRSKRRTADAISAGIDELREGDVVAMPGSHRGGVAAIVSRGESKQGRPLAGAVTDERKLVRLGPKEFDAPPTKLGEVRLPGAGGPRQSAYRREVAHTLSDFDAAADGERGGDTGATSDAQGGAEAREATDISADTAMRIAELREAVRAHPVHHDPDLPGIEVWAHRHDELAERTERLEHRVRQRTGSLVRQFDRIVTVLADLGYLTGDPDDPQPTAEGMRLAGLYAETDLVLCEALRRGVLDDLDAPALAAVVSVFVFETRQKDPPPVGLPTAAVSDRVDAIGDIWEEITAREEAAGLPTTRQLDVGFAEVAWRWAHGAHLDAALGDADMTAGDFVRNTKQVADLLRQLVERADDRPGAEGVSLAATAHRAARSLVRSVVAYTGV